MSAVYKTLEGASRAEGAACDRRVPWPHAGGFVLILWWGSPSRPADARVLGTGGRILADGVQATEQLLGLS